MNAEQISKYVNKTGYYSIDVMRLIKKMQKYFNKFDYYHYNKINPQTAINRKKKRDEALGELLNYLAHYKDN